ncbi:Transaldolase [Leucoagaricus sp. SymC.cos]|nr:Transaldolase [Leucoagaricus sp. SymC.cos]
MAISLLQQLRSVVVVDVDSNDSEVSRRHTTAEEKFHDMTSNQALVYNEAIRPENADLVKEAIHYVQSKELGQDPETFKLDVIDAITVLLGKRALPYLSGSIHAQTSPSVAYDTEKTIAHAKKIVAVYSDHGISKERVCIKIPATPESLIACQYLQKIGIQTLATTLFSLPQALAASQAGCKYVAPYFNELRVHWEKPLWKEYSNPATEHPMSAVILSIVASFQEIKSQTLVMPARHIKVAQHFRAISRDDACIDVFGVLIYLIRERVCIKIPATPESLIACQYLQKIGIQTLATTLFSLPQALAASQAGCKYVAPYFNELRVHWEKPLWKEYSNPATEHPMSAVILSIVASFQEIKSQTLVMPASIVTPGEAIALASLNPDHITISGGILDQLAAHPAVDEIKSIECTSDVAPFIGKDYLTNGSQLLREAIAADAEIQRKLKDALEIFGDCERKTKEFLDTVL